VTSRAGAGDEHDLREVVLIGVPVALYRRAQERHEELMRELALVDLSTSGNLPRRLLDMVAELRASYGRFTEAQQGRLAQAIARGDQTIDLHFSVPASVAESAAAFLAVLDESDEFCRSGDLLALEITPPLLRLRHWYFGQFIAQIGGAPPTPWRDEDDAP
jgi:hypothetical protein